MSNFLSINYPIIDIRYLCADVGEGCVLLNWYTDAINPDIVYGHIGANKTHTNAVFMNNSELIAP